MASKTLEERMQQPFAHGEGKNITGMCGYDNAGIRRAMNAAGSGMIDLLGVDQYNRGLLMGAHNSPLRTPIVFTLATNASLVTQRFFIADRPMEIVAITEIHATADGAANTATITKEVSGQAPGTGVAVMTNTFDMNGTANTEQIATLQGRSNPGFFGQGEPSISLNTGEMLSFKIASAVTSLAGVQITIYALPYPAMNPAVYTMKANADIVTACFYLANDYVTVTGIQMAWDTKASGSGTITIDVTKDSSTNAPGAGVSLLTAAVNVNNTSVPNVPVNPALTATTSRLSLVPGDRLAMKTAGTLTALAGLTVVVSFSNGTSSILTNNPTGIVTPIYNLLSATNLGVDTAFFTANREYRIADVSAIWSVAGGSGATVTVTIDTGTTAPGGGTTVITALVATTTANTTNVGVLSVSRRNLMLPAGGRLSVHFGGTTSPIAGLVVAASLQPRLKGTT